MVDVPVGTLGSHHLLVSPEWTIDFIGSEEARVFATPYLIAYLELTARNALKPYLADDEESVGTMVNIRHLAATPVGMSVRFEAKVLSVDGRRVVFSVEAWDEKEKIGEGTHERFVVQTPRFISRLAMKRSSVE